MIVQRRHQKQVPFDCCIRYLRPLSKISRFPFSRMDGASIPTIEIAQKNAYTALFGVSTQDPCGGIAAGFNFLTTALVPTINKKG
jgi:hypothetical protein